MTISCSLAREVLFGTGTLLKEVFLVANFAFQVLDLKASFDFAGTSLECEVGKAVGALSSLVPDTSSLHSLADALRSEEEAAFASNTLVVVVGLAVLDLAISTDLKFEGFVAFFADVINLIFAAQDGVHHTNVAVETVSVGTFSADLPLAVRELDTVFDS